MPRIPPPTPAPPPTLTPPKPHLPGTGDEGPSLISFRNLLPSSSAGPSGAAGPSSLPGSSSSIGGGSVAGSTGRNDPVAPPLPPRTVRVASVGGGAISTTPQTVSLRPRPNIASSSPTDAGPSGSPGNIYSPPGTGFNTKPKSLPPTSPPTADGGHVAMGGFRVPGYDGDMQERIQSWVAESVTDIHQILIGPSDTITKIGSLYNEGKITHLQIIKDPNGQGVVLQGTLMKSGKYTQFIYEPNLDSNSSNYVIVLSDTTGKAFRTADGEWRGVPGEEERRAESFFGLIS